MGSYTPQNDVASFNRAALPPNNFDLVRLLLAADVFFLHLYFISGMAVFAPLNRWANAFQTKSSVAVSCFFVVSGFLIFRSFDRSPSLMSYIGKRIRRVYPAYAAVILTCSILGVFVSTLSPGAYVSSRLLRYVAANLTFLTFLCPSLPGVFTGNHIGPVVNGALWTLKVEVSFYAVVPLISSSFRWIPKHIVLPSLYFLSTMYRVYYQSHGNEALANQLPGQLSFFIAGAIVYVYLEWFMERFFLYAAVAAGTIIVIECMQQMFMFYPLCLAVVTLFVVFRLSALNRFEPKWDISYGVYIWHFPILQLAERQGLFMHNPIYTAAACGALTLVVGCLSWTLIESKMLPRTKTRGIINMNDAKFVAHIRPHEGQTVVS